MACSLSAIATPSATRTTPTSTPCFGGVDQGRFDRCKALYEDFCIVTESVRHGIRRGNAG